MNNNMKDQFVLKEKKILIVKDDPYPADWKQILLAHFLLYFLCFVFFAKILYCYPELVSGPLGRFMLTSQNDNLSILQSLVGSGLQPESKYLSSITMIEPSKNLFSKTSDGCIFEIANTLIIGCLDVQDMDLYSKQVLGL